MILQILPPSEEVSIYYVVSFFFVTIIVTTILLGYLLRSLLDKEPTKEDEYNMNLYIVQNKQLFDKLAIQKAQQEIDIYLENKNNN